MMRCPLCLSSKSVKKKIYLNDIKREYELYTCSNCGLKYLPDLKKDRKNVYGKNYSVWGADEKNEELLVESSKKIHFRYLLSKLRKFTAFRNRTLLDIGTGKGYLMEVAKDMGFKEVYGLELSKFASGIAKKKFPGKIFNSEIGKLKTDKRFDVIVMTDLIEHLPRVKQDFDNISRHLKDGGYIIMTTPNSDSITRRLSPKKWFQYKFEHVIYFNKRSMKFLLKDFDILRLGNSAKLLKAGYYKLYLKKYSAPFLSLVIPKFSEGWAIKNPLCGELLVIARKRR